MNSIEIDIKNHLNNIYINIDTKKNIIRINESEKSITEEQIDKLIRIIRTWKNNYYNPKIIDGETFIIKITTADGINIIKGQGEYPRNYILLKEWIREIYE